MPTTNRLAFDTYLHEVTGCKHIYFQPPENIKMVYPAIVYSRNSIENVHADNVVYMQNFSYTVTVLDYDPDSDYVDILSKLPNARFSRSYISDNINHNVFTLFF